jgi:integrase
VASACNDLRAGLATLHDLGLAAESRKRDSEFQSHEIATLKRHLSPIMQDLFDALLILPFRVSELCGVRWKHFDQINRTVTIWRKDNDKDKTSYKKKCVVTLPVIEVGEEGHEVEVDTFDLLFGRDPKRQMRGPFEIGTQVLQMRNQGAEASRQFSWAVKLADLGGTRRFHDTRSNAMSNLFTQGFDVSAVCHLSGHTDWKMVQERYARLRPKKVHGLFKRQAKTNQIARRAA